jgi:hypothetical protein
MDTPPHKRGKPFEPGNHYGKGRAAGSRNKATPALEQLLEGESEGVVRKLNQLAKKGDLTAMRLYMERVCPVRRERPVNLDLPEIHTADDVAAAFRTVMRALALGDITTDQADRITRLLEFGRKSIETQDLAARLAEVENILKEFKESHERRAA